MSEQVEGASLATFRPYAYRDVNGVLHGIPQPGQQIPPPLEPEPEILEEKVVITESAEPVFVELSIFDHFDAIIAKIPTEELDEEKQRLLDIARDEVESVKRTVNRALTYGT
jgi:hypothetical protein